MTINTIDNYFNKETQDQIEKKLSTNDFPWYYIPETVLGDINKKVKPKLKTTRFNHAFKHFLYNEEGVNSGYYDYFNGLFKFNKLIRVKINLLTRTPNYNSDCHNQPHVDVPNVKNIIRIYYVNNSDGDTFFFDKKYNVIKKVSPKKGRLIEFNGDIIHAGSNPIKNERRMVININEFKK